VKKAGLLFDPAFFNVKPLISAIDLKADHAKIFCVSQTYPKKEQSADI